MKLPSSTTAQLRGIDGRLLTGFRQFRAVIRLLSHARAAGIGMYFWCDATIVEDVCSDLGRLLLTRCHLMVDFLCIKK